MKTGWQLLGFPHRSLLIGVVIVRQYILAYPFVIYFGKTNWKTILEGRISTHSILLSVSFSLYNLVSLRTNVSFSCDARVLFVKFCLFSKKLFEVFLTVRIIIISSLNIILNLGV